ncbi:MAG: hypothetical protein ACOYYJ_16845 [Chloroflexota bacterium]
MRDAKYLGLGLLIGLTATGALLAFLLIGSSAAGPAQAFLAALTPTATPIPPTSTPSPTATPTQTPSPTEPPTQSSPKFEEFGGGERRGPTASATATLTITGQMIVDGGIVLQGPLSGIQQAQLYETSLRYIAPTRGESLQLSRKILGIESGDPSNICGPLAISILREAGLVGADAVPYDFWLLNPFIPEDRRKLNRVFPSEEFDHLETVEPINKIAWASASLLPGDFLYIKHGSWGNFDHMLVVNRVDANGRAYAVTNYNGQDGFVITEAPLYDPNDPKVGLFYEWTKKEFAISGSTGFGGFELWRKRATE